MDIRALLLKILLKSIKKNIKLFITKKTLIILKSLKNFPLKINFLILFFFAGLNRQKCSVDKSKCLKTNFLSVKDTVNYFNTLSDRPHLIFISTSHVYGSSKKNLKEVSNPKPKNLYAKLKLRSENYIKKNYSKYCILRLFNVYGKGQPQGFFIPDMIDKIKKKQKIIIDKSVRDFVHVDEVSNIINFIIKKNMFSVFNAGSGIGHSLRYVINKIGKKIKAKPIISLNKTSSKIVADMSLLKSFGYKSKKLNNANIFKK